MAAPSGHQEHDVLVDQRGPPQGRALHLASSSSDGDEPGLSSLDVAAEDEADQVVGVSMGRTQSRMKARQTPAEEKSRVMERNGGYFDSIPDIDGRSEGVYLPEIAAEPERREHGEKKLASPTQNQLAKDLGYRASVTRSVLKNSLPRRPRAWSGDTANINFRKLLPDLGSLTKRPSLHFRSNYAHSRHRSDSGKGSWWSSKLGGEYHGSAPGRGLNSSDSSEATEESISELRPVGDHTRVKHSYARRPSFSVSGAPSPLRRSSSDQSLYLRSSSTSSSLDKRYQFENVHSQVNVRFKAIKDSLQDSGNRLLNMPVFNFQEMRSDFTYKPPLSDAAQRRAGHHSDGSSGVVHEANRGRDPQPLPHKQSGWSNSASWTPELAEAMSEMTGDVVIIGGYRGSILRSAKPPQRQLWVPMKVGLNLRKVDLEVGLSPEDEERMEENIIPSGVLSHIGPVDICRKLLRRLETCENAVNGDLRVWNYGYDWRLSPHLLAKKLVQYLEGLPCNAPDVPREKRGAYMIAHSLGGLITRHAVNQRPELFAGVVYAGVPQHCVNILGPLRDGDDILLSSRVLTAQANFSFRTSFALLPEKGHCFFNKQTKEEYLVDFFDPQSWDEYHLSPCVSAPLPPYAARRGLKDNIDMIGKRFSTVLNGKDSADGSDDLSAYHTPPEHPRTSFDPVNTAAANPVPNIENIVGPTSNPAHKTTPATTTSTIPRDKALAYLGRTLSEVRQFKQELDFNPAHQSANRYPPFAVIFGKSVPTVYGARVWSREQIKHTDAYDDLAFAAGDGVCLASAAMLPQGYRIIRDGLVKSERGHVGLLGDLEGVGRCLRAIVKGRREGVGLGDGSEDGNGGRDGDPSGSPAET